MKPANTSPIKAPLRPASNTSKPSKPAKGDINACRRYVRYLANKSKNPNATRASLWVRFINWSFLDEKAQKPKYTGWKQQQKQLASMK